MKPSTDADKIAKQKLGFVRDQKNGGQYNPVDLESHHQQFKANKRNEAYLVTASSQDDQEILSNVSFTEGDQCDF